MQPVTARCQLYVGIRFARSHSAHDADHFHALAVLETRHDLFDWDFACFRQWRIAQLFALRTNNYWRIGAGARGARDVDDVSRLGAERSTIGDKDAAGFVLHEKLAAPAWLSSSNDSDNMNRDLLGGTLG